MTLRIPLPSETSILVDIHQFEPLQPLTTSILATSLGADVVSEIGSNLTKNNNSSPLYKNRC